MGWSYAELLSIVKRIVASFQSVQREGVRGPCSFQQLRASSVIDNRRDEQLTLVGAGDNFRL